MSRHPHKQYEPKLPPMGDRGLCWPWRFYATFAGVSNCVTDREGRLIVSQVPVSCGPMLAAGPTLLIALERIARMTKPGSMVHEVALQAVECHRERDAIILQEEKILPRAARQLRIAGIAC